VFTHAISSFADDRKTCKGTTTRLGFLVFLICEGVKGLVEVLQGLDYLARGGGGGRGGGRREGGRDGEGKREGLQGRETQEGNFEEAAFGDGGGVGGRGGGGGRGGRGVGLWWALADKGAKATTAALLLLLVRVVEVLLLLKLEAGGGRFLVLVEGRGGGDAGDVSILKMWGGKDEYVRFGQGEERDIRSICPCYDIPAHKENGDAR